MKLIYLTALLTIANAQYPGTCNNDVLNAFAKCSKFVAPGGVSPQAVSIIGSTPGHLSICYGDWPECNDLQNIGLSAAGDCTINIWKGSWVNVRTFISPCPNPMPPRVVDKQFCTATKQILSEFYTQLFTDVVHNNDNEKLSYNQTSQNIIAKSNGQCLEAVPNPAPSYGFGTVKTSPCDLKNENQKWAIDGNRVRAAGYYCLTTDPFRRGSVVSVAACDYGNPTLSNQFFADCTTVTTNYVRIVSTRGKRISEYYSGLYFNDPANNFNELFTWDASTQMFKSASSQQCLDSFLDSDGKYKIHTYNCDVNNGNQKWIVHTDTKQIEHATHKGQCLDGDPTYADHHLQMWACGTNNPNQQWNVEPYTN
ncbi:hypothetical protein THRCLA_10506 [Thraustotheca clavata]|uniref:Secreted protein n=1 Tax=Thraustotheca clavata TaxID=74557 RepID=A0A0A7CMR7_9STRA|nr:secreted protein [Thraustotheca clavata]OQR86946.1 hypothetical protein THRCLA_10506 [Thraustotheca clavata]